MHIELTRGTTDNIEKYQSVKGIVSLETAKETVLGLIDAMGEIDVASSMVDLNRRFNSTIAKRVPGINLRGIVDALHEENAVILLLSYNKTWVLSAKWLKARMVEADVPEAEYYGTRENLITMWVRRGIDLSGFEYPQIEARKAAGVKRKRKRIIG